MASGERAELAAAARALAAAGLVDAFGHVSVRLDADSMLITPPCPLGDVRADSRFVQVRLNVDELPPGVPKEAWLHLAVYRRRPDVGAVCRAQPDAALRAGVAGVPVYAVHGQGALLGDEVPVHDDARLVRDAVLAEAVAETLDDGWALILRGNGAVTAGRRLGHAISRMGLLESSARLHLDAAAAGRSPRPLSTAERSVWQAAGEELLDRIWDYMRSGPPGREHDLD